MGSQEESPTPSIRSKVSQVELIAWDPESTQHVERMRLQRIACGWKQEKVESWRGLQRAGKITLQWVVSAQQVVPLHLILTIPGSDR